MNLRRILVQSVLLVLPFNSRHIQRREAVRNLIKMIDDQDLGFFANVLGITIFMLVVAYHYVLADPKYEG
ncbi:unnamed protein product [Closterium sp. NIES-54]